MRRAHARANYFAFLPSAGRATHDSVVRTSVVVAAVGGMRSQPLVDSNPQLFSDPSSTMLATGLNQQCSCLLQKRRVLLQDSSVTVQSSPRDLSIKL